MIISSSPTSDLVKAKPTLTKLAQSASHPNIRRAAYAAIITADNKPETNWAQTESNPQARVNLVEAVPTLIDPALRANFQPILIRAIDDRSTTPAVREAALRALPSMGADNAQKNFAHGEPEHHPKHDEQ